MAFGFSVGDFLAILEIAKGVYDACKHGPAEYKELCNETKSMRFVIQSLLDDARDPNSLLNRKGFNRKDELDEIIRSCTKVMREMQALVNKHSRLEDDGHGRILHIWDAYQVGSSDLDVLRGRMTFYTSMISMFLLSLEGSAIARIEMKLDKIYARMLEDDSSYGRGSSTDAVSTVSILSEIETREDDVWAILRSELLEEGVSMAHIMANKESIIKHVKSLLEEDLPIDVDVDSDHDVALLPIETNILSMSSSHPKAPAETTITILGPTRDTLLQPEYENKGLILDYEYPGVELVLDAVAFGSFRDHPACFLGFVLAFSTRATAAIEVWVCAEFASAKPAWTKRASYSYHQQDYQPWVPGSSLKIVEISPKFGVALPFIVNHSTEDRSEHSEDKNEARGWPVQSVVRYIPRLGRSICQASWVVTHPSSDDNRNLRIRLGLMLLHDNKSFVGRFQMGRRKPISRIATDVPLTTFIVEGRTSNLVLDVDYLERYVRDGVTSADENGT
ncbi:hypothetical protein N7G274_001792 [Stereocaulon virgatum]|uniref:Fungal N-terminal domain-containing protein n=1 Tax=Stereocaulon virgatum TaxID=373712 RepID=A0ABR4ALI9_9LECA